ncbi:FAD-dependent oxidoreductase [Nocardia asteroides]|nr:FAD-dependent oxidoreductase [Nocardia asteroides]
MVNRTTTVIVGASIAGIRAATTIRRIDPGRRIVVVDGEDEDPYDKPPLSKAVLTQPTLPSVLLPDHLGSEIDHRRATFAVGLNSHTSTLGLHDGSTIEYDSAILATGSTPRRLAQLEAIPGVHYLRTLADAISLRRALQRRSRVVIIGGGFIGCEVAASARKGGHEVTIIEAAPRLAMRVMPEPVSEALTELHEDNGVTVRCGTAVRSASHDSIQNTVLIELDDETTLVADVVVVGIGTEPNTGWAASSAVPIDNGFVCGPDLRVEGMTNVFAIGDAARWLNPRYGQMMRLEHWTNAREHAVVAARNASQLTAPCYATSVPFVWSDQYETRIQHVGDPNLAAVDVHSTKLLDTGRLFTYSRNGVLVGATGFNAQSALAKIRKQLIDCTEPDEQIRTKRSNRRGRR